MKRKGKTLKQALSFVLAGAMVFGLMPVVPNTIVYASDTGDVSNTSNVSNEASEQTTLDVSKGDITIGDSSVNGYDESGNAVTIADADGYIITGTTDIHVVKVTGGTHNITLKDVNIDVSNTGTVNEYSISKGNSAISLNGSSVVSIVLVGENVLKSGAGCAGLSVGSSAELTIGNNGSLTAIGKDGGAGIGADFRTSCGKITVDAGNINAEGSNVGLYKGTSDYYAAGIGGSGNNAVGTITIKGGNIRCNGARGWAYGAADIGSGTIASSGTDRGFYSADATVIINGGNIKAKVIGIGTDDEGNTATVVNGSNEKVYAYNGKLFNATDNMTISGVDGLPEYYKIENLKAIGNEFCFWLPENAQINSITSEGVVYTNDGLNVFIDLAEIMENPEISIDDGNIEFGIIDGVKYYTISGGDKNYYTGEAIITGGEENTTNYIVVSSGEHNITLENVNIDASSTGSGDYVGNMSIGVCPFSVTGTAIANVKLAGVNVLKGGAGCAGLSVEDNATVVIDGSGSLTATGNMGAAGIGANYNKNVGSIIINGGYIIAKGSYYAWMNIDYEIEYDVMGAGIGCSGENSIKAININGGTVIANGYMYNGYWSADIGSGFSGGHNLGIGYNSLKSSDVTVIINGGCIKADVIGAGCNDSGYTGAIVNSANESVSLVTLTLEEVTDKLKINSVNDLDGYGLNNVYTIDGKLYLYLPESPTSTLISTSNGLYEGTVVEGAGSFVKHDCSFDVEKSTYTADDENDTISITCNTCGMDMGKVVLYAPVNNGATNMPLVYDGLPKEAMSMYYEGNYKGSNFIGHQILSIIYVQDGTILDAPPVNVGNYMASIQAPDGQIISVEFTINNGIPYIGTVTAGVINDTLDINAVVLDRTDKEVEGFLYLTDTELKYGTHTYNWEFIPDNPNFVTITGTVEITVNDTIVPTIKYEISGTTDGFKECVDNVAFKTFFDTYKTITLTHSDGECSSGLAPIRYYIANGEIADTSTIEWENYSYGNTIISLDKPGKYVIYVCTVDGANNEFIGHTEGIVIYNDSVMDSYIINGLYKDNADSLVQVTLKGNTIKNILDNDGNVLDTSAYTVSVDGDTALVKISADYLNSLKAGNYTYTIFFAPQGVETDTVELSCEFIVNMNKEEIWVSSALTTDRLYDGSNLVDVISVALQNVRLGDDVKVDISNLKGTLESADAGYYILVTLPQLTLIGEDADNYILVQPTEAVQTRVTISQAKTSIGTVTASIPDNTLDVDKVVFERTDKTLAGSLTLLQTELQYGVHTYSWMFVPDDANYETITGTVEITAKDTINPTVTYRIDTEDFKEFTNSVAFEKFYDAYKTVEIVCGDNENGSGIKLMQYYVAKEAITDMSSIQWENYTGAIDLNTEGTYIIYVRVVDNEGNEVIKHTEGIVIYKYVDMLQDAIDGTYKLNDTGFLQIMLNGNAIDKISDNNGNILDANTYTVIQNGDTTIIYFEANYLNSLKAGNYSYTIYFNPCGIETGAVELTSNFEVNIAKVQIQVSGASAIDRIYDGTKLVNIRDVALDGIMYGDDVRIDVSGLKGTLESADAGTYRLVTLPQLTLMGADADNYIFIQSTEPVATNVVVFKKEITEAVVVTDDAEKIYNGKEQIKNVTSVKVDGIDVTYTVSGNIAIEVGNYELTITGTGNYTGTLTVSWSIEKPPYVPQGLCKAEDGNWYYYVDGVVDTSYTGMAKNKNGWWYITNGKLDTSYTGMAKNKNGWWYITNGKLDTSYTGMAENKNGLWYMNKGKLDRTFTGMCKYDGSWVYVSKGKQDIAYIGLVPYKETFVYVKEGVLDTTFTGMYKHEDVWVFVYKGKLNTTYTGMVEYKDRLVYVREGKLDCSFRGMVKYNKTWIYVKEGKYDTSYTGMAENAHGTWYMSNGELDLTFTGMVKYNKTWIYVKSGKHITSYTGMAKNAYGTWYMLNGELDLTFTGMAKYNSTWVYVNLGKHDTSYTGMARNKYGWWQMTNGTLDLGYTGISTNEYGWWYMKNGELDLTYTGECVYNGKVYKVQNGKVVR